MDQSTYWVYSTVVATIALIMSSCSILLGWINRKDNRRALLLSKKTEVLDKIYARRAQVGHLLLLYAEMLLLFSRHGRLREQHFSEHIRVRNNLKVLQEELESSQELAERLRETAPTDIEAWEDMLITAKGFLSGVTEELEKEGKALERLKGFAQEEEESNIGLEPTVPESPRLS